MSINLLLEDKGRYQQKMESYKAVIKGKMEDYNASIELYHPKDNIYGIFYYFYRTVSKYDKKKHSKLDTDNIIKPIWDSLRGLLYKDDNQLKFVIGGSLNISYIHYNNTIDFNFDNDDLLKTIVDPRYNHIIYIECGYVKHHNFIDRLEMRDGNKA
ncbi:RusA family crossover junction endodeoxyribonuclease [Candidatus Magnetominusculus dajiuhuensis]|uniref:RusA family crossover junction endodeoxyribonuclease n=1 Tax=Candidatus Magnetominusculus dajiuhuensis TaxID=3137712 RepID=UPI003B4302C6